uniref:Uncharacterized protein n=1 Tax=Bradyrhizobium japonicum TaxID=375 RepID=Q9L8L6_BRAJP|nr:unknown [Bradyrhizobium japonicum]
MGLKDPPFARRRPQVDVGERQIVAIQQLGDLGGGRQRLFLGAAIGDRLGAQRLDTKLELVERGRIGRLVHRLPARERPTDRMAEGVSVKPRPLMPQSARCYARRRTGGFLDAQNRRRCHVCSDRTDRIGAGPCSNVWRTVPGQDGDAEGGRHSG